MKLAFKALVAVTFVSTLVAPPLCTFAQLGMDQQHLLPPQRAQNLKPPQERGSNPEGAATDLPLAQASHHAFYYRPGDIKGVPYQTIEECWQARENAGKVGVCVLK